MTDQMHWNGFWVNIICIPPSEKLIDIKNGGKRFKKEKLKKNEDDIVGKDITHPHP